MSTSSARSPLTFAYKTFVNTDGSRSDILLDIHLPSKCSGLVTPVIWIHTGGFLQGTRRFVPPHLLRAVEEHGMALVTPDFRLCPQVSILQVLEDVADSIKWTLDPKARAASGFDSEQIFSSNYVLGGSSAGGWPALLLGLGVHQSVRLSHQPRAVFAIYPITTVTQDLANFFYEPLQPLPWALDGNIIEKQPLEDQGHLERCIDAEHKIKAGAKVPIRTEAAPAVLPVRAALYNFARQEGCYPTLILHDSVDRDSVCTPTLIRRTLPAAETGRIPVLICYGDADEKVPCSQSVHVIHALEHSGYSHDSSLQVYVKSGADHLFDMNPEEEVTGFGQWLSTHA